MLRGNDSFGIRQSLPVMKKLILTLFICIASLTTFGQNISMYRTHHQKLLANQTTITERIDWRLKQDYYRKTFESEIFLNDWDNDKINPFTSTPVIGEKIDIRRKVSK